MNPRNRILLCLFLALIGVAVARGALLSGPATPAPLFPGFDPARVASVHVEQGASGPALELARVESGWSVQNLHGFPANAAAVLELLGRLRALRASGRVSEASAARERYGLTEGARTLALLGPGGESLLLLAQGREEGGASHVLPGAGSPDAGSIFRALHLPAISADPLAWIDTRLPVPPMAEWKKLGLALRPPEREPAAGNRAAFSLEIVRDSGGTWSAAGRELQRTSPEELARAVENLYFRDVVAAEPAPEHGLEAPWLEIQVEAATRVSLSIGAALSDGSRALSCGAWERRWVVSLPQATCDLLERAVVRVSEAASSGATPSKR